MTTLAAKARYLAGPSSTLGLNKLANCCQRIGIIVSPKNSGLENCLENSAHCDKVKTVIEGTMEQYRKTKAALAEFYGLS